MNCFGLFTLGHFQTPSIGISDKQDTPFLLLAGGKLGKGRHYEQTSPLPAGTVSYRKTDKSRAYSTGQEYHMAIIAGELFAREPLQAFYAPLDKHRFAFSDKQGIGA